MTRLPRLEMSHATLVDDRSCLIQRRSLSRLTKPDAGNRLLRNGACLSIVAGCNRRPRTQFQPTLSIGCIISSDPPALWSVVVGSVIGFPVMGCCSIFMVGLDHVRRSLCRHRTGNHRRYHRLLTHRSFECPDWVKACLLVAGGWALQNSGAKWTADHLRHHAHCDDPADPYNAKRVLVQPLRLATQSGAVQR